MRISAPLTITLAVSMFLAGCGGQETSGEKAEEESSVEETTTEETNNRAEATVEETTAPPVATAPLPVGDAINSQEEESINAPPEEAVREQDQAQPAQGINVAQTAAPDPATVGSPLTFTITVTNNSPTQHVGFKDFLPPGMTPVSATPSQGVCGMGGHGSNDIDCTLGVIPNGGSVTVEVVAIPTVPGTMTNLVNAGGGFAPVTSAPATITENPARG